MFLIKIYLYLRWNIIKILNFFVALFALKMLFLALIIPVIQTVIQKQTMIFYIKAQWYKNIVINSFNIVSSITVFDKGFIKLFTYTIIFFFMYIICNIFAFLFIILNAFLNIIRIYHYFLTSILENIVHYSDKYTTKFKKQNTWFTWAIYKAIKTFFALRLAFMVFDLFLKGSLYWVYKKIEPKMLALVEYYYKRTISGHFFHFKAFLYVVVFYKS